MKQTPLLVLAAAAALLASACTISEEASLGGPTTVPPAVTSAAPQATDPNCDPKNARPSLRPVGPLPSPGSMPVGSTMKTIQDKGKLVVGVSQDTLLFSFLNPETGKIEGFDVNIAKEVARAIFGDPEKVELKAILYSERLPKLESGEVDLVADTMTINCARWARISFSTVYYESGQQVLVRRDSAAKRIEDLRGKRVCAATGSTSIDNVRAVPGVEAVDSPDWVTCLVRLQQGRVDGISTDDTILAGLAAQDPYTLVIGERFTEEPYGLGINKQHEDFVRFVNAVLEQIRTNNKWVEAYEAAELVPVLGKQTPPAPAYRD